ncbi:MAG: hypothetical protein J2P17_17865 [Mycobacterium sp.]|nr:hypothetical protein [Mycobacterium sp.]
MSRKHLVGWGSAATVVLGVVITLVIRQLNAGWGWWVVLGIGAVISACLTAWLSSSAKSALLGAGGVRAGQCIRASVSTEVDDVPPDLEAAHGVGAVEAGGDIDAEVATKVTFTRNQTPPRSVR